MTVQRSLIWVHRWTGLVIAAFLVAAGLSGSVLVFQYQLDAWLNPELFHASTPGTALPPSELVERVHKSDPRIFVSNVPLRVAAGEAAQMGVSARRDPSTGRRYEVEYDQVFVDPVSGQILGTREGDDALIPQIYEFHYTLLAPGGYGKQALGIVAIVWTINCFIGLYLTFPQGGPFFRKWKPAWLVKYNVGFYRLNFDLHRAGGLWSWGVMLVLAVSSIYMNLNFEVFRPTVRLFSSLPASVYEPKIYEPRMRAVAANPNRPLLSIEQATAMARAEVARLGEPDLQPSHLSYFASIGVYRFLFRPSQFDRGSGLGRPILYLDASDGHVVSADTPSNASAGQFFARLQYPLHSGRIAGVPGRIIVFLSGILITVLSLTGIYVWWKKRQARIVAKKRSQGRRAMAMAVEDRAESG